MSNENRKILCNENDFNTVCISALHVPAWEITRDQTIAGTPTPSRVSVALKSTRRSMVHAQTEEIRRDTNTTEFLVFCKIQI